MHHEANKADVSQFHRPFYYLSPFQCARQCSVKSCWLAFCRFKLFVSHGKCVMDYGDCCVLSRHVDCETYRSSGMTWLSDKQRDGISTLHIFIFMWHLQWSLLFLTVQSVYSQNAIVWLFTFGYYCAVKPLWDPWPVNPPLFFVTPWPFASKHHPLLWLLPRAYFFVYTEPMWSFSFKKNKK